tara:strand:+ start:1401 stop:1775 length:375 start_codon:yes stop_codon:yes gene_type:complete
MAKHQLKDLHLYTMQSVLPAGIGIFNTIKSGGFSKVINICRSEDPFSTFQVDGEMSAKMVRDKIDQLLPGLGNPVVSVNVTVAQKDEDFEISEDDSLLSTLNRIEVQLNVMRQYFNHDSKRLDG